MEQLDKNTFAAPANAEMEYRNWCMAELERRRAKLRENKIAAERNVGGNLNSDRGAKNGIGSAGTIDGGSTGT